jgi:hypothetical protein
VGGGQGLLDRMEALMEARNRKYTGAGRTLQDAIDAVKVMDEWQCLTVRRTVVSQRSSNTLLSFSACVKRLPSLI